MNNSRFRPSLQGFRASALSMAMLAAMPCAAQSLRVDYQLGVSLLHSDNINLSDNAPDSDSILSPSISFDASQAGSTTQLRARGMMQYLDYRDSTYSDEFRGEFAGQFNWTLLPQRLNFLVEDYLGRQPIDVLNGFNPGNQQQINVFTAGPSLYARFGAVTRGQFDLRYSNTYAEETTEFNGNRYNVSGRLFRDLDASQWLSANLEATQARFDDKTPNADYKRYDGYAGYRRESNKVDLDVALGYTRLERESHSGHESSPLARARLDWRIAPRSLISANVSYEFADAASDLVAENNRLDAPVLEDIATPTLLVGPQVYRERRYELGYAFKGERLAFQVRPYLTRIDYLDAAQIGWKSRGTYASVEYRVRPLQTLSLSAMFEKRDYVNGLRSDDDSTLRAAYEYRFSRHLSGFASLQRRHRNSDIPGQDYRENLATLGFVYRR